MKLNLCCMTTTEGFKTMTFKTFNSLSKTAAISRLDSIILDNFRASYRIAKLCSNNGWGYRMSSSIAPLITHPAINIKLFQLPSFNDIRDVAAKIAALNIRLSFHPSEYISLTSDKSDVISSSIADLELHGEIMDLMGLEQSYKHPINIHIRKEGDKNELAAIFLSNFDKLSNSVKRRLVLENNDNPKGAWSVKNLVETFGDKIPITFDNLHHRLLSDGLSEREAFFLAANTWQGYEPIFHYSEGIFEDGVETRKHEYLAKDFPKSYGQNVSFDVELKGKELAIKQTERIYNENV